MATRGRKPGFVMDESHRTKIQNSRILNILLDHVQGSQEMSQTQVTVAIALMKKVLPDLSAMDINANVNGTVQITISARDADL